MGTSLNGLTPAGTYPGLIKTGDNTAISGTPKVLSDGNGNNLPMEVSTTGVNFTNNLTQGGTALQPVLVSGTNIKTINGTSVLGSGNIVTPSTPPSGVAGAIQFSAGSAFNSDAANFFWDNTNKRLGVGTNAPDTTAHFKGGVAGSVGTRIATLEGSLPEILFKDTSNNSGFAIAKYGQIVYFVNTNASGGYVSYSGLTNSSGQWSFGGGFNPSATVHAKGSGSTSATTSLLVQNSAGTQLFTVQDDGTSYLGTSGAALISVLPSSSAIFNNANAHYFATSSGTYFAQLNSSGFQLGNGAAAPNASAIVDLTSTTKGFLPPRGTNTQMNAISSPATGLVFYDTTNNKLCVYNATSWIPLH